MIRTFGRLPVSAAIAAALVPWAFGVVMAVVSMADAPAIPSAIAWHARGTEVAGVTAAAVAVLCLAAAAAGRRFSLVVGAVGLGILSLTWLADAAIISGARDDLYGLVIGARREPSFRVDPAFFERAFSSLSALAFVPVLVLAGWSIGGRSRGGLAAILLCLCGLIGRRLAEDRAMDLVRREVAPPWAAISPFTPLVLGHPATQRPWIVVSRNEPPDLSRGGDALAVDARLPRPDLARLLRAMAGRGLAEIELVGERYRPAKLEDPITASLIDPGIHLGGVIVRLEHEIDPSIAPSIYCGVVEAAPSASFVALTEGEGFVLDLAKPPLPRSRDGVAYVELGHTAMARDLAIAAQRLWEQGLEPVVLVGDARCSSVSAF
jgi:hypothetical protein